jgi:hypothetical protein
MPPFKTANVPVDSEERTIPLSKYCSVPATPPADHGVADAVGAPNLDAFEPEDQ